MILDYSKRNTFSQRMNKRKELIPYILEYLKSHKYIRTNNIALRITSINSQNLSIFNFTPRGHCDSK